MGVTLISHLLYEGCEGEPEAIVEIEGFALFLVLAVIASDALYVSAVVAVGAEAATDGHRHSHGEHRAHHGDP